MVFDFERVIAILNRKTYEEKRGGNNKSAYPA
jgi:hypothetical protein